MNNIVEREFIELVTEEHIQEAINLLDRNPTLISTPSQQSVSYIATVLLICDEIEECIRFCEFNVKKFTNPDLYYNLAYAYEISNLPLKAIRNYQCSKLLSKDLDLRSDIHKHIQSLRYPQLDDVSMQQLIKYQEQEKAYILEQLKNPQNLLSPEEYITTTKPDLGIQKPKILYGTMEIANHISHYLSYFRSQEFDVLGVNYFPNYLEYNCDFSYNPATIAPDNPTGLFALNAIDLIADYDVFHFVFNRTLMPNSTDIIPLKQLNKKVFMHNLGSEIRIPEIAKKHHPFWNNAQDYLDGLNSEMIKNNLKTFSRWIDHCIVNDYEMKSYVKDYYKNVHMIGLPIDLEKYAYKPQEDHLPIRIVHAPTNKSVKGSIFFEEAIEKLSQKYHISYQRIENMDHEQAINLINDSDIVLDQLIIGTYGSLAMESMAMGKCIVSFINPNLDTPHNEPIPIWNTTIENVYDRIEEIILSFEKRLSLSNKARNYVERNNDCNLICEKLLKLYCE
jgi:hypothetical protein